MKRTVAVIVFFIAAVLAGMFLRYASPVSLPTGEKETFAQPEVGMPLDMQSVEVSGYSGTQPLLGSEPKAVPEKPYDMANDTELFMFEGNKVGSECCPSPFSGDRGCICLTEAQRAAFGGRGGNRIA